MSQAALGRTLGVDAATVSLMLRGFRKITLEDAAAIARVLGRPVDEVLKHAGVNLTGLNGKSTVPVVGWIDGYSEVRFEVPRGEKRVERPPLLSPDAAALRVMAAMTPMEAKDGWVLYFEPIVGGIATHSVSDIVGRLSVVKVAGGPCLVKNIRRGYDPGTFQLLSCDGSVHTDGARLEWGTPIRWVRC